MKKYEIRNRKKNNKSRKSLLKEWREHWEEIVKEWNEKNKAIKTENKINEIMKGQWKERKIMIKPLQNGRKKEE